MTPAVSPADTSHPDIDAALADLSAHATEWARLPVARKVALLEGLRPRILDAATRWVTAASRAKGLAVGSPLRGEEWSSGPWALASYVAPLATTLRHIEAGTVGEALAGRVRQRDDGQTVVRVVPGDLADRVVLAGLEVDVWMEPGVEPATVADTVGVFYEADFPEGGVALVLGAGNIASIPPLDVLYKLYAEGQVVILKLNPVNDYLGPILENVFAEFVAAGYLRFAYGGADVGQYLTQHEAVDEIHMTGSAATHDAIVYGTGPEGAERKRRDEPVIDTPVSSELGGVSPCIVVPGDWSEPDLRFQAEHVVSQRTHNAGFNCIGTQVLVLPEAWPQRQAFLNEIRAVLAEIAERPDYYPGADERLEDFQEAYPQAEQIGGRLLAEVSAEPGGYAFETEVFGSALAVATLPGGEDAGEWLERAVAWANTTLAGTLGATVLIHPRTKRALGDALEDAIAELRYGTVGVNQWAGAGFLTAQAAWGAFPGHVRNDIQSGTGVVHNSWLFDRPQKTVVWGYFAPFPRSLLLGEMHAAPAPLYFVTNETADTTARRATEFATSPSVGKLAGVVVSAFRG
ncbi:aldehyde dehydrogenase family protein [Rubrivirga sp. IMCC45206]|uniref:aldehyde dehydrogenase family protein n=1 Tax=Rubrivirga sp. IMCC45206 TaxID=3391614 RepID=UPI00399012CD